VPDIPWTYVTRLLSAAANAAEERGLAVSISVADRDGAQVGALRMPGAAALTARLAAAKAYTSASFRNDSDALVSLETDAPSLFAAADDLADQPLITTKGGVAIRDRDTVVGAIGVSGGTGDQDVEIAAAAIAAHPIGAWMGRG